jgi:C4-dicarboxylate-binding protein DctP
VTQGAVGRELLRRLERQQMLGLGFMDNGFKQMSALRALRAPADFQGLRVRVQASGVLNAQMQALGARPVALPFGETERALAQGVADAAENPVSNYLTQGLARWQPHLTLTRHGYLGYAVVSHPRFWASLAREDRAMLTQALSQALAHGNRLAAELNAQALAQVRRLPGVQVHELALAERAALLQAVQPAYEHFRRGVDPGLLRDVHRVLQTG